MLLILLLRGPHCRRYTWFGYEGGLAARSRIIALNRDTQQPSEVTSKPEDQTSNVKVAGHGPGSQGDETKIEKVEP